MRMGEAIFLLNEHLFLMRTSSYPSDLTDAQWALIAPLIPPPKTGGRRRTTEMRDVVDGILYQTRSGCQWRMLPGDFPPWGTVHYYYRQWRLCGVWQSIHDTLREKVRIQAGKGPTPSAAIIDSQSVKSVEKGALAAATTRAKRSPGASATSWSTPWD